MRRLTWWIHFKNYFPVSLVKTHDLPADKSYLFATYPHGVLCAGSFSNFATDAGQFSKLFPGLTSHLITLNLHFIMPFTREICIGLSEYINFITKYSTRLSTNNGGDMDITVFEMV